MTSTTTRDTFGSMSYGLSNVNSNNLFYGTSASSSDNVTSAARAFTSMSLKNGDSLKNYDWDAAEVAHLLANDSMVDPSSVTRPVSANQRAGSFLNNGAFGGRQTFLFLFQEITFLFYRNSGEWLHGESVRVVVIFQWSKPL